MTISLGKLNALWEQWKTIPDGDPRKTQVERDINGIEKWMIKRGLRTGGITRFHSSRGNPHYPAETGCIRYEDLAGAGINDGRIRAILLSTGYEGESVVLKLYSPKYGKIILVTDRDGYRRSVYVTPEIGAVIGGGTPVKMRDSIRHSMRDMVRITGSTKELAEISKNYVVWNGDMRQNHSYVYDMGYSTGAWYDIVPRGSISPPEAMLEELAHDHMKIENVNYDGIADVPAFRAQLEHWASILSGEVPDMRRVAFDIEVESNEDGLMPDPEKAESRVTAISFCDGGAVRHVNVLRRDGIDHGTPAGGFEMRLFDTEEEMLEQSFRTIASYPVVITYNGDSFDMPYLFNRAARLGIEYIPFRMMAKNATLDMGIHIDMYGVFSSRSLKIYAFNNAYVRNGLDDVAMAMLGEGKTEHNDALGRLSLSELAGYCYNDARLTYELTTCRNSIVPSLLVNISRLANLPIDDVSRRAISSWVKSMIYSSHVRRGELVPNSSDFPEIGASTSAMVRDRKYQGATVLEPKKGVHFGVTVLDFASLYPSIIKSANISYDTVCCPHVECRTNLVPNTSHWVCTRDMGMLARLIGSLKEIRVNHFKRLPGAANATTAQALKVFLNASYGVVGADTFPLYFLPTAESVTAMGREIIMDTVTRAGELGATVLYGDTDSIFIKDIGAETISELIRYALEKYRIDLEVDKEYKCLLLSDLKKNYFGIRKGGDTDIKGLAGKKSNTPMFIQRAFMGLTDILSTISAPGDIDEARRRVTNLVRATHDTLEDAPLEEMAYNVRINQDPAAYKIKPQVLRAAEQLDTPPKKGQFVSFIKCLNEPHVVPIQLARRENIDYPLYETMIEGTLKQVTSLLGMEYDIIRGRGLQTRLDGW